ncbi:unnamed protein product [Allacma fusca]|uniref:LRRCT domain-containing protein n=1 Tax=Allacma fusca TaxID=39272 RepID=A0A8J2LDW7_9HEXA|nr:unnamed protein product [Allacma fusca]
MKGDGWLNVIVVMGLLMAESSYGRNICPTKIQPCTCTVKTKGLVINCENSNSDKIVPAMTALKESHGVVISYLTFRTNNMPRLPDHIFMGMDIRHLIISSTNLRVLEHGSLTALANKLNVLELISNLITNIPTAALSRLVTTRFLNLNHNNITVIPERSFEGMVQLQRLTLYANHITRIDPNAFKGVEKELVSLNLGANKLESVPIKAISKLPNLSTLELQENLIESITESDFMGLSNLDSLKLGHNQIKELGAYVFRSLPRMSSLDLESNRISRIDDRAFSGLEERLEWLKLGNNSIRTIPSNSLRGMHKLREFDVKSNNITEIKEDAFDSFGSTIKFLFLQNNRIDSLPMSVFSDMHSLETLSLSNNGIHHVPRDVFQPIIETVQVIDVHDNPLKCDCDLTWYKNWIIKASQTSADKVHHILLKTKCWSEKDRHEYMVNKAPLERLYCPDKSTSGTGLRVQSISALINGMLAGIGFIFSMNLLLEVGGKLSSNL